MLLYWCNNRMCCLTYHATSLVVLNNSETNVADCTKVLQFLQPALLWLMQALQSKRLLKCIVAALFLQAPKLGPTSIRGTVSAFIYPSFEPTLSAIIIYKEQLFIFFAKV